MRKNTYIGVFVFLLMLVFASGCSNAPSIEPASVQVAPPVMTAVAPKPEPTFEPTAVPVAASAGAPSRVIFMDLTVSNTESVRLGDDLEITAVVLSQQEAEDVSMTVAVPDGLELVGGEQEWSGDIKANETETFTYSINLREQGEFEVSFNAAWAFSPPSSYGDIEVLCISVDEESVSTKPGHGFGECRWDIAPPSVNRDLKAPCVPKKIGERADECLQRQPENSLQNLNK